MVMNRCPKMEYGKLSGEWAWVGGNPGLVSSRRQTRHASGRFQSLGSRRRAEIDGDTSAAPGWPVLPDKSPHRAPAPI